MLIQLKQNQFIEYVLISRLKKRILNHFNKNLFMSVNDLLRILKTEHFKPFEIVKRDLKKLNKDLNLNLNSKQINFLMLNLK